MKFLDEDYIKWLYTLNWEVRNRVLADDLRLEVLSDTNGILRIGKSDFKNPKGWKNVDNLPPYNEDYTFEDYCNLIPNFEDPYPSNVHLHHGILVVRDDLIPGNLGSKARYAEALMQQVEDPVLLYAMVPSGQALKVLASVAKKYNKLVIGVAPLRKEPTIGHIEAMERGAVMFYYQTGGMAGARKRCRAIIHENLNGKGVYIPSGVKHEYITAGFAKSVNKIYKEYYPDVIFCSCSTAVMAHGIDIGTPDTVEVHAVQVAGNSSLKKWPRNLICYEHNQPFTADVKREDAPPFPSISNYDAKAWKYALAYKKENPDKRILFWNVAGPTKMKDIYIYV